jgi:gliding motility-associated-like protein
MGPNGFVSSLQNPIITSASSANTGTYTLIVSGNGCTSSPATDTVSVITIATPMIRGTDSICAGDSISLTIINPITNAFYLWSGPSGFSSSGSTVNIFPSTLSNAGTYTVYDSLNGCISAVASFSIFIKPSGPSVTAYSNSPVCYGDTIHLSANGGNVFLWTGPNGFSSAVQNPKIYPATPANAGTYIVSAILNGCHGNSSSIKVVVNALPILSLGSDTTICSYPPLLLQPSGNYYSYLWNNNSTNNSILVSTMGVYSLTVTDANGCKATSTIKIGVIDCGPKQTNIFTPNGDGVNDQFTFSGYYLKKVRCEIYDRWGRKIYGWDDPNGGWDGTDFRTKQPVSDGTYYYVASITGYDDNEKELKGFLELIR